MEYCYIKICSAEFYFDDSDISKLWIDLDKNGSIWVLGLTADYSHPRRIILLQQNFYF